MRRLARGSGVGTAGILTMLGLIHVYWALRGVSGRSVALPERHGRPVFQPSRTGTLAVASGLFAAALMLLVRTGALWLPVPDAWPRWGAWTLASLFALRAIGNFRYVGIFKRVTGTPFARWDSQLFVPLCILIAAGSAVTAWAGPISHRTSHKER